MSPAFTRAVDHEGEIALDRLERRQVEHRLGAGRLRLRLGNALEDHFEGHQRALGVERFERARMQLAEIAEHVLRADLDRAAAAGMEPGRAARHDLQRLRRRAGRGEHRQRIGLGVEGVDLAWPRRPVPPAAGRAREPAPHAGRRGELVLRPVALEHLPDLEQRDVGIAAVGILLRRARRGPGIRLGRMSERSAAIGLASASSGLPPPKSSACGLETNDQVTASTMPRAASARLALRVRIWIVGQHRLARVVAALERRRRHAVDADDAHDLLDDVGLAMHVGRHDGTATFTTLPCAGDEEAEPAEHALHLGERHVEAGEALHLAEREIDDGSGDLRIAGDDDLRRLAAAEVEHHPGRELQARHHEGRIDAALEAIARIGIDAELAAGLRDVERLPQRRFRSARRWSPPSSRRPRRP